MNAIDKFGVEIVGVLSAASIKGGILLPVAWVVTFLMRRASGASRHLVWTLAVFGVLAFPALERALPRWHVAILPAPTAISQQPTPPDGAPLGIGFTNKQNANAPATAFFPVEPGNALNPHDIATSAVVPVGLESSTPVWHPRRLAWSHW